MFNKKHFDHRFEILELYLTVRDPGTSMAAEAYDGLRKLLISANKGTQTHLAHLAGLHKVANTADSLGPVQAKIDEYMSQMGVFPVEDTSQVDLFQVSGGKGTRLVVDTPAYVAHGGDGRPVLVQQGVAHYEEDSSIHEQLASEPSQVDGGTELGEMAAPQDPQVAGAVTDDETEMG